MISHLKWKVEVTRKSEKQAKKLPQEILASFRILLQEMSLNGPYRSNWKNYGKLRGSSDFYHCHIFSGKPTYVVCWEIKDKTIKIVEVYYVGTHENAPY